MTQAGKRWAIAPAAATAAFVFSVAGASAGINGGWDHLGDYETPKVAPLNGAVYTLCGVDKGSSSAAT